MKIALLGAESTGKSTLARDLCKHWQAQGVTVHRVDEYLREWCDAQQRTPRLDEQAQIAQTQMARVLAAPPDALVIADTTPLMTAVYSQMVFGDHSLDALALAHHKMYDLTLLMGLDLAWVSDGLQREGAHVREPVDQKIRQLLAQDALPYQVVYGKGPERLAHALYGMARLASQRESALSTNHLPKRPLPPTRWQGVCERCGDGECEHRLFTGLPHRTTG